MNEEDVLTYMRDRLFVATDGIDLTTPLVSSGIIDSFALVELLTFIEDQTGVRFNPADATVENIDTIELILKLVERSRGDGG